MSGRIESYITTVERTNKSYSHSQPKPGAKLSALSYAVTGNTDRFTIVDIHLETGRKHRIRVQMSSIGCPIRGDLKYGDKRSNPDGSISLQAYRLRFIHPVSKEPIDLTAPWPENSAFAGPRLHWTVKKTPHYPLLSISGDKNRA